MTGFLGKLFGKKNAADENSPKALITSVLGELIERSSLDLQFDVSEVAGDPIQVNVEIYGNDEEMLRSREGQLLDSIQLFLTRVLQNQLRDERINLVVDNAGFRDQANQELTELAERLKNVALEKGRPVYVRAMPPRERKIIHQYLAADERVKSRSVGEGLYKKIKIFPLKGDDIQDTASEQA